MQVVCLKWGDRFTEEHVNRLYRMVCKNYRDEFEFVCYTENANGIDPNITVIPLNLKYDLEKWWWKMVLFEKPSDEIKLFLDLDVVIQKDITHLKKYNIKDKLCLVKSYWKPYDADVNINSSIMIWSGDLTHLFKTFITNSDYYMLTERGIDPLIFKNFMDCVHFLKEGECYSRLYGIDANRCWNPQSSDLMEPDSLFYDSEYNICIFNGWKRRRKEDKSKHVDNSKQPFLLEDDGYHGFEHYWS